MIDVQPFIDKLEKCKEYMNLYVEWWPVCDFGPGITILSIYKQTGNIPVYAGSMTTKHLTSFEEYLKFNATIN